ncbi:hypothetical protein B0J18DRAFT_470032 [Chaetomium sp. MPI-SDFR-AT-0129]|nr:hypothetical protein B0J18DRAFT_470032 [Chaetomium sp. MPI-SDFR-AT-0129]
MRKVVQSIPTRYRIQLDHNIFVKLADFRFANTADQPVPAAFAIDHQFLAPELYLIQQARRGRPVPLDRRRQNDALELYTLAAALRGDPSLATTLPCSPAADVWSLGVTILSYLENLGSHPLNRAHRPWDTTTGADPNSGPSSDSGSNFGSNVPDEELVRNLPHLQWAVTVAETARKNAACHAISHATGDTTSSPHLAALLRDAMVVPNPRARRSAAACLGEVAVLLESMPDECWTPTEEEVYPRLGDWRHYSLGSGRFVDYCWIVWGTLPQAWKGREDMPPSIE